MSKFKQFTHEKTSRSIEGKIKHFDKLKTKHTSNAFIIVGHHRHSFSGALAVEFKRNDDINGSAVIKSENYGEKESQFVVNSGQIKILEISSDQQNEDQAKQMQRQANQINTFLKAFTKGIESKQNTKEVIKLFDQQIATKPRKNIVKLPFLPIFNKDQKYFTPTFIIPKQKIDQKEYLTQFQRKIADNKICIPAIDIMEPRPRKKHLYCGICKESYQEYLGHIRFKIHQENAARLIINQHIKSLELQMNIAVNWWQQMKKKRKYLQTKQYRQRKKQQKEQQRRIEQQKNSKHKAQKQREPIERIKNNNKQSQEDKKQIKQQQEQIQPIKNHKIKNQSYKLKSENLSEKQQIKLRDKYQKNQTFKRKKSSKKKKASKNYSSSSSSCSSSSSFSGSRAKIQDKSRFHDDISNKTQILQRKQVVNSTDQSRSNRKQEKILQNVKFIDIPLQIKSKKGKNE